jgi:hypothetical protein
MSLVQKGADPFQVHPVIEYVWPVPTVVRGNGLACPVTKILPLDQYAGLSKDGLSGAAMRGGKKGKKGQDGSGMGLSGAGGELWVRTGARIW